MDSSSLKTTNSGFNGAISSTIFAPLSAGLSQCGEELKNLKDKMRRWQAMNRWEKSLEYKRDPFLGSVAFEEPLLGSS